MLSTPSSSDFFQLLHVFQIQVFPFFFSADVGCKTCQSISARHKSYKNTINTQASSSRLFTTCFEWCWNTFRSFFLRKAHVKYMWGGSADVAGTGSRRVIQGWILRGLKHLLYITITDFDHCLHYFSLYCLFFYGKADRSELGALI